MTIARPWLVSAVAGHLEHVSPLQLHIIAPPLGLLAIKLDVEDAVGEHFAFRHILLLFQEKKRDDKDFRFFVLQWTISVQWRLK